MTFRLVETYAPDDPRGHDRDDSCPALGIMIAMVIGGFAWSGLILALVL